MQTRELFGMTYKSVEIEHSYGVTMSEVLEEFAHYLRVNSINGVLTSFTTSIHPDDEDLALATLIYSPY